MKVKKILLIIAPMPHFIVYKLMGIDVVDNVLNNWIMEKSMALVSIINPAVLNSLIGLYPYPTQKSKILRRNLSIALSPSDESFKMLYNASDVLFVFSSIKDAICLILRPSLNKILI